MTKLKTYLVTLVCGLFCAAIPTIAWACDVEHGLRHKTDSASYRVFVNGVFFKQAVTPSSGFSSEPLLDWLLTGENIVRVDYDGADADFSITKACRGDFPDDEPVDQVSFDQPGSKMLKFNHDRPIEAEYLKAESAGDAGLLDAIKNLQEAVRLRDTDAVFLLQAPLFRDAARQGYPIVNAKMITRKLIETGKLNIPDSLIVTPVMGGRVYQVLGSQYQRPVSATLTQEDGTFTWHSGTFWARFDGKWGIVGL